MDIPLVLDKTFSKKDYTQKSLEKAEYDSCTFINCNFDNSYLSSVTFLDCEFIDCNLSNTKLKHTTFKDVIFKDCKMIGMPMNTCNTFMISFTVLNCTLDFSIFAELNLTQTTFKRSKLNGVDFTNTNLESSVFDNCDLTNTIFENTNLKQVDFTSSYNYAIKPELNNINHAKFSRKNIEGLIKHHKIVIE